MKKDDLNTLALGWMLLAAAGLLAGCQQQGTAVNHGENFAPDNQPTAWQRLERAQSAAGAAEDATLYPYHFSGNNVNSLGRQKLDLMLAGAGTPLSIWIDIPDDANAADRRASVLAFLKDRGVAAEQVVIATGANPATDHPADHSIKDLSKTDSDAGGGPAAPGIPTAAPPSP